MNRRDLSRQIARVREWVSTRGIWGIGAVVGVTAVILAVTIIGIPFAWAHVKLAGIALWPIGKVIVPA